MYMGVCAFLCAELRFGHKKNLNMEKGEATN